MPNKPWRERPCPRQGRPAQGLDAGTLRARPCGPQRPRPEAAGAGERVHLCIAARRRQQMAPQANRIGHKAPGRRFTRDRSIALKSCWPIYGAAVTAIRAARCLAADVARRRALGGERDFLQFAQAATAPPGGRKPRRCSKKASRGAWSIPPSKLQGAYRPSGGRPRPRAGRRPTERARRGPTGAAALRRRPPSSPRRLCNRRDALSRRRRRRRGRSPAVANLRSALPGPAGQRAEAETVFRSVTDPRRDLASYWRVLAPPAGLNPSTSHHAFIGRVFMNSISTSPSRPPWWRRSDRHRPSTRLPPPSRRRSRKARRRLPRRRLNITKKPGRLCSPRAAVKAKMRRPTRRASRRGGGPATQPTRILRRLQRYQYARRRQ